MVHTCAVRDTSSKTCRIHFYIEDSSTFGKYKQETIGRSAIETIHWSSITRIVSGQWKDGFGLFQVTEYIYTRYLKKSKI